MRLVNEPEIRNLFQATSFVQEKLGRILVMNDAAHSLGAYYSKNQRTGCETDIAIFSLHAVKNVTTAEGGAICLNLPEPFDNAELYKELRMMSLNCQTKDAFYPFMPDSICCQMLSSTCVRSSGCTRLRN